MLNLMISVLICQSYQTYGVNNQAASESGEFPRMYEEVPPPAKPVIIPQDNTPTEQQRRERYEVQDSQRYRS